MVPCDNLLTPSRIITLCAKIKINHCLKICSFSYVESNGILWTGTATSLSLADPRSSSVETARFARRFEGVGERLRAVVASVPHAWRSENQLAALPHHVGNDDRAEPQGDGDCAWQSYCLDVWTGWR